MSRLRAFALATLFLAMVPGWSQAGSPPARVRGTVLETGPGNTVLMHHEAFNGMPSMTMQFGVPPGTVLHIGDRIQADVDTSGNPWSLSNIHVLGAIAKPKAPSVRAKPFAVGDRIPEVTFVDQSGRPVTTNSLRGTAYALTFIYTRCRDAHMCPLTSAQFHLMQKSLPAGTKLVEVTLDPQYDTPSVLAKYGATFGANPALWLMLTGNPATIDAFAARFGILQSRSNATTIIHSERLAVVDPSGRITRLFDNADWNPKDVLAALSAASRVSALPAH